jgi:hypothetical protein
MKRAKSTVSISPNTGSGLTTSPFSTKLGGGRPLSPSPLPPPHHVPPANEQTDTGRSSESSPALFCLLFELRPRLRGVVLGAVPSAPLRGACGRAVALAARPLAGRSRALRYALERARSVRKADRPPRLMARKPSSADALRPALEGATNYACSAAITKSAHLSPIMMLGALVLPLTSLGMMLASATQRPSSPFSLSVGSTTASASLPIRQVPTG